MNVKLDVNLPDITVKTENWILKLFHVLLTIYPQLMSILISLTYRGGL